MTYFSEKKLQKILRRAFPDEMFTSAPQILERGNLNNVWRVHGKESSYIIKHAPPYIASAPEVKLDPGRIIIEGKMLELFRPEGRFFSIADQYIRPPDVYLLDQEQHILLMEDVAPRREMDAVAYRDRLKTNAGKRLGAFIGKLHHLSAGDSHLAKTFDNRPIQQTRLEVQYRSVEELLKRAGTGDYLMLGSRAEQLGEKYVSPGKCLTMGDLWPRSVMLDDRQDSLRIIDWEFAHFGRPAQDVAHLAAHCWMLKHQAPSQQKKEAVEMFWLAFKESYLHALGEKSVELWDADEKKEASVHFGCEILVRTVGDFQESYLYAGLPADSAHIKEAVLYAASSIRESADTDDFFDKPFL